MAAESTRNNGVFSTGFLRLVAFLAHGFGTAKRLRNPRADHGNRAACHLAMPLAFPPRIRLILPLAARSRVGHIGMIGDVAEWLKAAVC
jgi:hypothetical protein